MPNQPIPPAQGFDVGDVIYSSAYCQHVLNNVRRDPKGFRDRATKRFPGWAIDRSLKAWGIESK